ncbi:MAG: glutamate--cysteine ligase, partial [Candidatus Paceibacteria bacterium]
MSSMDHKRALDQDQAREHIASTVFSDSVGGPELGRIGLEPEYLTFRVDKSGAPLGRLPLEGPSSVLSALQERVGPGQLLREDTAGPPPVYTLENGGRITFEPGAQVEHSTAVHDTAASAMDDVDHVASELAAILGTVDGQLASVGLDLWTDRSLVEQQLRADRYNCMAAYLDSRSQEGRVMMRHTGSFQINLDLGEKGVAAERWRLSNLLTPVALASFACSPEDGWASRRAKAWQGLDPTRTGFPACLLAGERTDPGECYAELALKADVLMFHDPQSGKSFPGTPGFRFVDWLEQGHPQVGFPGIEQLNAHLTTLFPEVRLRGFLEIRSTDAVPLKWRAAQVVFWTGLIYDREAR